VSYFETGNKKKLKEQHCNNKTDIHILFAQNGKEKRTNAGRV
jgi:hypothetical protein